MQPFSFALLILVLVYGAIAGLRTTADFDLGWQMAEARHPFSSTDMLSYTVPGAPWIYPAFAGILLRGFFLLGGYAAISWLCVAATVATLLITALRSRAVTLLLLLLAVPILAAQMIPRSGLFTVVIAAAYVRILLAHFSSRSSRGLWLLPVLMLLWVNLHTGFIAGLGLLCGYLAMEAIEALRPSQRVIVKARIRQALPWIAASAAATLINPWGWRVYPATALHEHISALQSSVIVELAPLYKEFSWHELHLLAPLSAIWWLIAVSILSIVLLGTQRRFGLSFFLAIATVACLFSARSQGIFIPIACLIAGEAIHAQIKAQIRAFPQRNTLRWVVAFVALVFVAWRSADVVSNRTALREGQITSFGAGASWWLPQRAGDFLQRNHLPGEVFSSFNLSSYLTWQLGPQYRDFADGRYLPFGDQIVAQQLQLTSIPLDAQAWSDAAAKYNIRTVIFPLSRFFGIESIPLRDDCISRNWSAVYLDPTAVIFVRNDALQPSVRRLDCSQFKIMDTEASTGKGSERFTHYQMLANTAVLYFLLGRNADAEAALEAARSISREDDSLVLLQGQIAASGGDFPAAEQFFRYALSMHSSDAAWYQLGLLYANQRRYPEAVNALKTALQFGTYPNFDIEWALAKAEALNGDTSAALHALDGALQLVRSGDSSAAVTRANIYDVEAAEYSQQMDWPNAIAAEQNALRETPHAANRWQILARIYAASGDVQRAQAAQQKAQSLPSETQPH